MGEGRAPGVGIPGATLKMGKKGDGRAYALFAQIGTGHSHRVRRPRDPSVDRKLRDMVADANQRGDCIINTGDGYYRPRPWVDDEKKAYNEYRAKERARAHKILRKGRKMNAAYAAMMAKHCGEVQMELKDMEGTQ